MHDDPQGAATAFDRTTAVTPAAVTGDGATHTFTAELDESWSSLRGVHGGSVAAVVARAAGAVDPARAVRTLSVSFLRPHHPGPISVVLDVVRTGRQLAVLAAHVTQDGRPTLRATLTLAAAGIDAPTWSLAPADAPAPRAACVAFTPPPGIRHFAQSELLLDPATIPAGDAEDSRIAWR
jgi:acyl-coenzyme A thioesterase PaaI-like protein